MTNDIKMAINQIVHHAEALNRETGKLIDPPDFAKCFDAVEDIECIAASLWLLLDDWEREENG